MTVASQREWSSCRCRRTPQMTTAGIALRIASPAAGGRRDVLWPTTRRGARPHPLGSGRARRGSRRPARTGVPVHVHLRACEATAAVRCRPRLVDIHAAATARLASPRRGARLPISAFRQSGGRFAQSAALAPISTSHAASGRVCARVPLARTAPARPAVRPARRRCLRAGAGAIRQPEVLPMRRVGLPPNGTAEPSVDEHAAARRRRSADVAP